MAMLEVRSLSRHYGRIVGLDNVTFNIESGKITGLLGPNGSGKTTFIKIAAGILRQSSGSILICGNEPGRETKAIVSYLPDRNYLPSWMSVKKLIDMFEDFYDDFDRTKAEVMVNELGLDQSQTMKQMSKGQKEKIQLIMVMSRKAKVYLLDEPLSGVDPAARDYILGTIIRNYNPDSAVIISTHLISDIENYLDNVLFINHGHIVLDSTVDGIRQDYGKSVDEYFREVFRYEQAY